MDCISFVYDYQLNIREISELGQGMRFSCFSSPLLGLGLDATLPIKSALFSMIQKPRDTSIYAILHTSIHFYAPLYTSIFNIVLSICYILLIFCLCGRFTASPNSELADWNSEKAKWCPWEECGDSSLSGLARPRSLVEPQPRSQTAWAVHFTSNKIGMKSDGSRMLIS